MRDKTPLVLMEQLIMLLVFALAAAVCLRAFVWADLESSKGSARDQAILAAERAAETLKACNGDFAAAASDLGGSCDQGLWHVTYDAQWQPTAENAVYHLQAKPAASTPAYMGAAELTVTDADGMLLSRLPVAWQEVCTNG